MSTPLKCPHCGSNDALPFEDDTPVKTDGTIFIILSTGALLFIGYSFLLISAYLFFPGVVFLSIIIATRWINRRDRVKKGRPVAHDYMCAECGGFFNAISEE